MERKVLNVYCFVSFHDPKLFFETEVAFSGACIARGHAFEHHFISYDIPNSVSLPCASFVNRVSASAGFVITFSVKVAAFKSDIVDRRSSIKCLLIVQEGVDVFLYGERNLF